MYKKYLFFVTVGLTMMSCMEQNEYDDSNVTACGTSANFVGIIHDDLFTAIKDTSNTTHAQGYCINTDAVKEYCVQVMGTTNYACSLAEQGKLVCPMSETGKATVDALSNPNHCGQCGHNCQANEVCLQGKCQTAFPDCEHFDDSMCSPDEVCRVKNEGTGQAHAVCAPSDDYCANKYQNGIFDVASWDCIEGPETIYTNCDDFDDSKCSTDEVCRVKNEGTGQAQAVCAPSDDYCANKYQNGIFDIASWDCIEGPETIYTNCDDFDDSKCSTDEVCRVKNEGTEQAQAVCAPSDDYCASHFIHGSFKPELWSCIADTDGDTFTDDVDECPYNQLLNKKIPNKDYYNECFKVASDGIFYIYHAKNFEELAYNSTTTDINHPFKSITSIVLKNDINFGVLDNTTITDGECIVHNWDYPDFNLSVDFLGDDDSTVGVSSIDGESDGIIHKITSTHPITGQRCSLPRALFNTLDGVTVQNLILDYDIYGTRGQAMLANSMLNSYYYGQSMCQNIRFSGTITTNATVNVGGLVATAHQTQFKDCIADGISIEAENGVYVGGLIGSALDDSSIKLSSKAIFKVNHIIGHEAVGGIVGYSVRGRRADFASDIHLIFDKLELSNHAADDYTSSDGLIGGFSGTQPSADNVIIVGNSIVGDIYSHVGGLSGMFNQSSINSCAVAIDEISALSKDIHYRDSVVSGLGSVEKSYSSFNNIFLDIGSIKGDAVSGVLSQETESSGIETSIGMITSQVDNLIGRTNAAGVFYLAESGVGNNQIINMNMISSFTHIQLEKVDPAHFSGVLNYNTENVESPREYSFKFKNLASASNRPEATSGLFNQSHSTRLWNSSNAYYYTTSEKDLGFSLTPVINTTFLEMNESKAESIVETLNDQLTIYQTENSNCLDCRWVLNTFNDTKNKKDVLLPYLKQSNLEEELTALKAAHCEAFGDTSKFCKKP